MLIKLSEKTSAAVLWIRDSVDALKTALSDIRRLKNKVDGFKIQGPGVGKFSNQPETMSLFINGGKTTNVMSARRIDFVKVTGSATGGGKYNGKVWTFPQTAISATGNAADADFGQDGGDCLIINGAEIGKTSHDLDNADTHSKLFPALFLGVTSDNVLVYGMSGLYWKDCA